jgi:hypothetical protein
MAVTGSIGIALLLWWEVRTPERRLSDFSLKARDLVMLIAIGVILQLILLGVFQPIFRYFNVVKELGLWLRILAIAPLFIGMFVGIRLVGRLWRWASVRRVFVVGLLTVAVSTALLAIRPLTMPYWLQLFPLLLFGFAIQSTKTVWSNAFFQTVVDDFIGLNAAIQNATLQIGGSLGALLGGQLVILFGYRTFSARLEPFVSVAETRRIYEIFSSSFTREDALVMANLSTLGTIAWEQYVAAFAASFGWTLLVMVAIALIAAALVHFFVRSNIRFTAQAATVDLAASVFEELTIGDGEAMRQARHIAKSVPPRAMPNSPGDE